MFYDLAIIGGGPAGVAAGVYAARKRLRTVLIAKEFGGQSAVSEGVENWIGTVKISGAELARNLEEHLRAYAGDALEIRAGETVASVKKGEDGFVVQTNTAKYEAKAVLVTAGSHRRKLEIPGAAEFENKGVVYCASCDGPLFAGKDTVVIGGGNAGFETAAQLLAYCKSVTLLNRSAEFKADAITVRKTLAHPRMRAIKNAVPVEIKGEKFVTALVYEDSATKRRVTVPAEGIFVEIGSLPSTEFVRGLVTLDSYGRIVTDPRNQRTSADGVWAAGDVTDGLYHQNNIAAGDAVKALEDIYLYLHAK